MFLEPVDNTVPAKLVHLAGTVWYKDIQIKLLFTVLKGHNVMQASQNKLLSKMKSQLLEFYPSQQFDLVGKSNAADLNNKAFGWQSIIHSVSTVKLCNLNYDIYILWSSVFSSVK